jgi:hypothetical protein
MLLQRWVLSLCECDLHDLWLTLQDGAATAICIVPLQPARLITVQLATQTFDQKGLRLPMCRGHMLAVFLTERPFITARSMVI